MARLLLRLRVVAMMFMLISMNTVYGMFVVNPCCSRVPHVGAIFGPLLPYSPSHGLQLEVEFIEDNACDESSIPSNGKEQLSLIRQREDAEKLKGKAVIVKRGTCSFAEKVAVLEANGAKAVIVYGTESDELVIMGKQDKDRFEIGISSVFIRYRDAMKLRADALAIKEKNDGTSLQVSLFRADEAWIEPILAIPPLLAFAFSVVFITLLFISISSGIRKCCCWGRNASHQRHYHQLVINNRGLLEPLGSNVVIVDGLNKPEPTFLPVITESAGNTSTVTPTTTTTTTTTAITATPAHVDNSTSQHMVPVATVQQEE